MLWCCGARCLWLLYFATAIKGDHLHFCMCQYFRSHKDRFGIHIINQMVLTFPCKIGTWYLVPGTSTSQRTLVPADSCLKQVEGLSTHSSRLCTAATARRRRFTAITTQVYINPQHFYSLPRYPQPKPKIPTYANPNQTKAAKY